MSLNEIARKDLDIIFNEADFAEPVVWSVEGGESASLSVLFEETYQGVDPDTEAVIMSTEPRFKCRADQMPTDADEGDVVEARNERFWVLSIQPDGLTVWVYLHREVA